MNTKKDIRKELMPIVKEVRKCFFCTIAALFCNYEKALIDFSGIDRKEFSMKKFKIDSEERNQKFYSRFFGDDPINVRNQLFTNFIDQINDENRDVDADLRKQRFDEAIKTILDNDNKGAKDLFTRIEEADKFSKNEDWIDIQEVNDDEEESKRNGPDDKKDVY